MEQYEDIGISGDKIGRNEECPCGSGKKFKKCCYQHGLTTVGEVIDEVCKKKYGATPLQVSSGEAVYDLDRWMEDLYADTMAMKKVNKNELNQGFELLAKICLMLMAGPDKLMSVMTKTLDAEAADIDSEEKLLEKIENYIQFFRTTFQLYRTNVRMLNAITCALSQDDEYKTGSTEERSNKFMTCFNDAIAKVIEKNK